MSHFTASNLVLEAMECAIREILEYPGARIFTGGVPQDIDPGSFVVRQIEQTVENAAGIVDLGQSEAFPRRQLRRPTFEVRYYPESDETSCDSECHDVEELLFFALEQVTTQAGVLLAAENMHSVMEDGTLVMTMDYPYIIEDTRYAEPMEHMELDFDFGDIQLVND